MIEIKSPKEVDEMRPAGKFVYEVLQTCKAQTKVGSNLLEIDELAKKLISDRGAKSCYVDYHPSFGQSPFGHYICTSINDAVLHGLPHDYTIQDGDLVSLDFACSVNGWVADSAISFIVGTPNKDDEKLIKATQDALAKGIENAVTGNRLGDISHAIGQVAWKNGYKVNLEFGGHGIGRVMHGEPHISNDGVKGRGYKIRPGLTVAIEPWFMAGTDKIYQDDDGWTLRSLDGSRGAHSEHSVAITANGTEILTLD
jgi:methionyl aminopeptidase